MMTSEYRAHINPAKKKNQLFKYRIHNRQHSNPTDSDCGCIYLNIHPNLLCMWSWNHHQCPNCVFHLADLAEIFQLDLSLLCVLWKCIQGTKTISNFFLLACLYIDVVSLAAVFRQPVFLTNKWLLSFAPHSFPDLSQSQLPFYFLEQVCTKLTFDMLSNHNIKYQQFPQWQTVEWCRISQL